MKKCSGKVAWDPELTEKPVTNTVGEQAETIVIKDKEREEESEIQAPESPTQL
ncbi:hypothetical protein [Chryseobacterium wanjuense]